MINKIKKDNNLTDTEFKEIKCKILYGGKMKQKIFIDIQNEIKENTKIILSHFNDIVFNIIETHG